MNLVKLAKIFFCLFLISIPFGTRVLLYQFTPGFNEYTSVFLYASDIFLVLFLAFSYSHVLKNVRINRWLAVFLLLAAVSIFFAASKGLAVYNFARLVLLVLMALAVGDLLRQKILRLETVFAVIAALAVVQSLIGFGQFALQSDLGLRWLGEPVLGQDISGAAKIVVDGVKILRAYGTFPHPNVLAAFLLLGLFALYYLWLRNTKELRIYENNKLRIFHSFAKFSYFVVLPSVTFITLLGLTLTFSRTAWIISIVASLLVFGYWLKNQKTRKPAAYLLLILIFTFSILLFTFHKFIFPRAQISAGEPAVVYRLEYNKVGLNLLRDRPLGVGIGNQVLYSVQNGIYQKFGMDQPWQWQPIHNIYLLAGSEIGILGVAAFIIFLLRLLIPNPDAPKGSGLRPKRRSFQFSIPSAMLMALLLFGLVDHFLWNLQSGRLMLWLVTGLLLGSVKSAQKLKAA